MRSKAGGGSTDLVAAEQQTIDSGLAKRAANQPLNPQEEAAMRVYDAAEARLKGARQAAASEGPAEAPIARVEKPIEPNEPIVKDMSKTEKDAARAQDKTELEEYTRKMREYNDYETRLDASRKRALVKVLTPLEKTATDIVDGASQSDPNSADSETSVNIIKALYNSAVEIGKRTSDRMAFNTTLSRIFARENIKTLMDNMEATDPEITTIKRFMLSARIDMMERMRRGGKQISVGEAERTIAGERMDSGDVAAINEALMREIRKEPDAEGRAKEILLSLLRGYSEG